VHAEKPDSPSADGFLSCGNGVGSFDFPEQHDDEPTGFNLPFIVECPSLSAVLSVTYPRVDRWMTEPVRK